jgi:hypothetical protein
LLENQQHAIERHMSIRWANEFVVFSLFFYKYSSIVFLSSACIWLVLKSWAFLCSTYIYYIDTS